ncbi:MAG: AAA family ATPase [Pseudomonadota bacterium]
MSTIEKAAERLAAKSAKNKKQEKKLDAAPETGIAASVPAATTVEIAPARSAQRDAPAAVEPKRTLSKKLPVTPAKTLEIDLERLHQGGFVTPDYARSAVAQEFRKIKRQVLNRIGRGPGASSDGAPTSSSPDLSPYNAMMVTSALAGEGKTYVAINLAMSLAAELDREVLLIDGDIAKADASRAFGIEDRVGLGQVLQAPDRITDAVYATNVPRLSLVPAGDYQDNLTELLASDLMDEIVRSLAQQNRERIVLFDAPPLLVTTEAAVLSRHVGHVLLVVEANRTPKDALAKAVLELGDHPGVMMMLNKATGSGRFGYGYGYGYGYGSSSSDTQESAVANQ